MNYIIIESYSENYNSVRYTVFSSADKNKTEQQLKFLQEQEINRQKMLEEWNLFCKENPVQYNLMSVPQAFFSSEKERSQKVIAKQQELLEKFNLKKIKYPFDALVRKYSLEEIKSE